MNKTIVTIKWGELYSPEYVNRLYRAVQRNINGKFRFVCFTDHAAGLQQEIESYPLPDITIPDVPTRSSNWRKLGLYQSNIGDLNGACLYLDLDIVITGPMNDFFNINPGAFCAIEEWVQPHRKFIARRPDEFNTSVFRFDANTTAEVYQRFTENGEAVLRDFRREQQFVSNTLEGRIRAWPKDWVVSFKRHCLPKFPLNLLKTPAVPRNAKIVAFHGRPNPEEVIHGFRDGPIHRKCVATPWVKENWH